MANLDLSATMAAIADALISDVWQRVYDYPSDSVAVPCILVAYPEQPINLDYTYVDGSDQVIFPVYYIAGKTTERNTRDLLSKVISGANAVQAAIDGDLGGIVNSANVSECEITEITVGGVAYAAVKFNIEIIS